VTDEGGGGVDKSTTLGYRGRGGLWNGHVVQFMLKLYQSILIKKFRARKSATLCAPIIHKVEEWLRGGNPFRESQYIN